MSDERGATTIAADNGAAALFRAVGLMADGPVVWGRPVPARGSGVFVIELPTTLHRAPIEHSRIGKWLEHVPELLLDGAHPTTRAMAARLEAFWLPSTRVLFVGTTDGSIGGRIEAIRNTVLGDRRPHPGGHWLHTLTGLEGARVWWAATSAVEESEDALLTAFAATIPVAEQAALHDPTVVLPFANLRTATGERKKTGLANSLVAAEPVRPTPAGRIVVVAPGAADGASGLPPTRAAGGTVRRSPRPAGSTPARPRSTPATPRSTAAKRKPGDRPAAETTWVSAEGMERLKAEHAELTGTKRHEVIGRIKAAKELGDLKENADYASAREEQSFLEGRIKSIEATLRVATVIETPGDAVDRVTLGSTVTVEDDTGAQMTFVVVGSSEADPAAGRISNVSPVGRALIGRSAGDDVAVAAPRGEVHYRIVELA
ncbi:MAG TPA: transcription elongation factor GreA [Candidatus Limnocylindrales bacterium]|nr:transcription elongation factor GreA [Candidatus Limnocylindrales bacterium]